MDIQPVVSLQDVLNYIAKYAAKSEVQSKTYDEILHDVLSAGVSDTDMLKKAARKLFIKSVTDRDYSA